MQFAAYAVFHKPPANKGNRRQRQLECRPPDFGLVVDATCHFAAEQGAKQKRHKLHDNYYDLYLWALVPKRVPRAVLLAPIDTPAQLLARILQQCLDRGDDGGAELGARLLHGTPYVFLANRLQSLSSLNSDPAGCDGTQTRDPQRAHYPRGGAP